MEKLQPGQMLGPYRIISQIGQGGMATVYKAYQPSMDRNVAIKVLPSQLADSPEFVKRFQQEARIIANLEHPHILPVFDFGEDDGVTYFVMRFLDAGTLKERMNGGALPWAEIDRLFTQLAEALGYAHDHGIVHRDLKPANALVDTDGNLFLTDFGIAKLLEDASPRLTQTDAIMGTPAYISPEQAQAMPVDRRSDIYSLGIILYEMVTGRVPFTADTPLAVILKQIGDPLPPPSKIKPDLPSSIERVILKALAKNPNDRFSTTAEFVSAWRNALKDTESTIRETEMVVPTIPFADAPPQTQRQPATATRTVSTLRKPATGLVIGCIAIVCLAASAAGVFVFASRFLNQPSPTQPSPTSVVELQTATAIPVITGDVILRDDFSQSAAVWGTSTTSESSIEYDDETLRIVVYNRNWFVRSWPDATAQQDVHLEVTAINNDTDKFTAFGLMCNQQADEESFYYFAITPDGQYVIAKAASGEVDVFLTNNDTWEYSDRIPANAPSYRLGADCGNGTLTLYVNGQMVDSVADSTYSSGVVGLVVWSAEEATKTDVSFDDFLMTELP
jgi:serine/threonine protein kinase